MKLIFGSDWGGVLNNNAHIVDGSRNSLLNPDRHARGYLRVKSFKGALETLRWLSENGFSAVHIVSRIDTEDWIEARVRDWLLRHDFTSVVPPNQVHFCQEMHQKMPICKKLGVTHFIDDQFDVLRTMVGVVPHLFLFRPWNPAGRELKRLMRREGVIMVSSWREVREHLVSQQT